MSAGTPATLCEKIWSSHVVTEGPGGHALLYIDRHLLHEGSTHAFHRMARNGSRMRRPDLSFATADHYVLTTPGTPTADAERGRMVESLTRHTGEQGVTFFGVGDDRRGIVHVIGPEQGLTLPGILLVCGDSHTATHGAFGCLAFGVGSTEVEHVMLTQTLWQKKPKSMRVTVEGRLGFGVTAKDVILAVIARIGAAGGVGHVIEYAGAVMRAMTMDERMTVCNMSIEAGARAGMVAPDETTFNYIAGKPHAPKGADWDAALAAWRQLPSDDGATYDAEETLDANTLTPMITYGTNPGMGMPIDGRIPTPSDMADPSARTALDKALRYMALEPGVPLL